MHTYPPPTEALDEWLESYPSIDGEEACASLDGSYGHLLLEQKKDCDPELVDALKPYFESAHLDAREHFHNEIGIDLHPDADDAGGHARYPRCLPPNSRRGLFGEVLAGLVTEAYDFVGGHDWIVPIFLFRYHADVEKYLFDLARDPEREREIFGRFGSDFLAISLDDDSYVARFVAGEAKWRRTLTPGVVEELLLGKWIDDPDGSGQRVRSGKGIWAEINKDTPVPHGVRQLQRLLQERDPDGYAPAILSMDEALLVRDADPIPRTDLVLIVGNGGQQREDGECLISWKRMPAKYTANNELQVVEVILRDGEELIDTLYSSLWNDGGEDAAA